ncbi:hypothetical protein RISK_003365 [Rhodopirellula islandica]|uniref:Uncharacterized protein n=1 Tax=Rhodopirellula islandica TaxID=595434 RepID=A0A0J1EGC5_RHOIS|nr:hypothetical protein RISK_003365 [Rhodopirellula islandica]
MCLITPADLPRRCQPPSKVLCHQPFRRAAFQRQASSQTSPLSTARVILLDDTNQSRKHLGTNVLL